MKIVEQDPTVKGLEEQERVKRLKKEKEEEYTWAKFKETIYYKMVIDLLTEEIDKVKSITNIPAPTGIKDLEEFGKLVSIQLSVYNILEKIRLKFINK